MMRALLHGLTCLAVALLLLGEIGVVACFFLQTFLRGR